MIRFIIVNVDIIFVMMVLFIKFFSGEFGNFTLITIWLISE